MHNYLVKLAGFVFVLGVLSFFGCGTSAIKKKLLSQKNPTSYEFSVPPEEITLSIKSAFGSGSYRGMQLAFKRDNSPFAESVFTQLENQNDAYLYNFHDPIGKSMIYFSSDNHPLDYLASFQIHLARVSDRRTRVDIITHRPEVIAGKTLGLLNPHGPANIYVQVSPTTIEEYELLLRIGNYLGVTDMPPLSVPGG